MPYALVTFGSGPRLCIGIHFATIEVKVLAAQVLRSYRLEPINNKPPGKLASSPGHSGWYSDACAGAQRGSS